MPWVGFDRSPLEVAQGMAEGNIHIASKFIHVISGQARADVSMLSFRGPDSFVVGNLQNHFPAWELIANIAPFDLTSKILMWIKNCVDVYDFFQPYRGGRSCHFSLIPFYGSLQCKENKILFTIHNFTLTYVQGKRIYKKVTSWAQLFEGRLALTQG